MKILVTVAVFLLVTSGINAKNETTSEFQCYRNDKGKGEPKIETCSRKSAKYCIKGTPLEGERKGKTFLDCTTESEVKGEFGFTKTPQETLECEEVTISLGYAGDPSKYEICVCSSELCNGSSTSKTTVWITLTMMTILLSKKIVGNS